MTTHEVRNGNGVNETTPRHPDADAPSFRDAEALPTQVPLDGTEETSPRAGEPLGRAGETTHRDGKPLRRTGESLGRAGKALLRTGKTLRPSRERSGRSVIDEDLTYDHILEQTFPASDPPPPP